MKTLLTFIFVSITSIRPEAFACNVTFPKHALSAQLNDGLSRILQAKTTCPTNIKSLTAQAQSLGLKVTSSMVANRGFHNPNQGSFSFFEEITGSLPQLPEIKAGHFFWGHFTTLKPRSQTLSLDQANTSGKLLIEVISWDFKKQVFNFYELIGGQPAPRWFYRGDSADIWADNEKLYRQRSPQEPLFGQRLRCAACHTTGGPIMKELQAPHNDWWRTARPLWLNTLKPDEDVTEIMARLQDASLFSKSGQTGMESLLSSEAKLKAFKTTSLQEILRPLFCDQEMNLVSGVSTQNGIELPSDIWRSSLLTQRTLGISKKTYQSLLQNFAMGFPETRLPDADHPWLTPTKATSDVLAIQNLVKVGLIDPEFVTDVLAVDMKTPLFSEARCKLLQLVPNKIYFTGWKNEFINNLKVNGNRGESGATELLLHLTSPHHNQKAHQIKADRELMEVQNQLRQISTAKILFQELITRRQSVFDAEISKNPRGQILEPGFRVIFPVPR